MATYTGKIIRVLQNGDTFVYDPSDDIYAIINIMRGANSGLAELDVNGKVPSAQLPSYVDDVLEYANLSGFPATGESGKIYVALDTNLAYRWSGSTYVEISQGVTLGTTSSTAYRGDHGLVAYNHATDANKLSWATESGFYKVAFTADGHVAGVTPVTKDDITGLGIPGDLTLIAQEYEDNVPFNQGVYRVHNHKLYLASVGSDLGEVWTSAHWTEVHVMDEVLGRMFGLQQAVSDHQTAIEVLQNELNDTYIAADMMTFGVSSVESADGKYFGTR